MKIKNEAELLSMFCDKNEYRSLLRAPFFNTKYNEVWGTNGHILIRIKPERLVGEYPKGELALPILECPCKKKITIEAINNALGECPKVDEEIIIQDAIECEECDGSGEVYWEYTDNNLHTHERLYDCPVCDGKGKIKPEITRKTGKKIVDKKAVIKVGDTYMLTVYVSILKSTMEHLNASFVEMLFNPPMGMSEFAIGDIRIGVAPFLYDEAIDKCCVELKLIDL